MIPCFLFSYNTDGVRIAKDRVWSAGDPSVTRTGEGNAAERQVSGIRFSPAPVGFSKVRT